MKKVIKHTQKNSKWFVKICFRSLLLVVVRYRLRVVVTLSFFLLGFGLFYSYVIVYNRITTPSTISDRVILERVGRLMVLPEGPPASIMRVENADRLRSQNPFFAEVKEGEYIIAYENILIIYDVLENKVIGNKIRDENKTQVLEIK